MLATRRRFRLAVVASLLLHVLLACGVMLAHWNATCTTLTLQPDLDTRLLDEPRITMRFEDAEVAISVTPHSPPAVQKPTEAVGSRPEVRTPPRVLPSEMLARVRQAMVNEPLEVQPASAAVPARPPVFAGGEPIHGVLQPGQTIVYVLDASGSMGQSGKFPRACRALLATLRQQPESVRFQVIVYAGVARALLPGGCVPTSHENIERTAEFLASIEPAGRSAHADALKLAGRLNPEFVLVFTDGDDLPANAVRDLSNRLARPASLAVVVVRNDGIDSPRPWCERGLAP